MADIDIGLGLDTKEATKNLGQFKSQMEKDLGGLQTSFGSLAKIGAAIGAGFAALKVGQFLKGGIADAIEAEKSLAKLANQLKVTGEFSKAAVRDFDEFAGALENATNVSAEAVLEQIALAKSFGLSNQESKELVSAATQLSAITGDDLSASVDTLLKSYQGQSRQLSLVIGDTAKLTKEQLKNGDAIRLINKEYGGTAEATLNTFGGALTALERSFGDIGKEIGTNIIQSESLIKVINRLQQVFTSFNQSISKSNLTPVIDSTLKGILAIGEGFARVFGFVDRIISGVVVVLQRLNLGVGFLSGKFLDLQEAIKGPNVETSILRDNLEALKKEARESLKTAENSLLKGENAANQFGDELAKTRESIASIGKQAVETSDQMNKAAKGARAPGPTADELEKLKEEYRNFANSISDAVLTESEKIAKSQREQLIKLESFHSKKLISEKEFENQKTLIEEVANKQRTKIAIDELQKRVEEAKRNPFQVVFEAVFKDGDFDAAFAAAGVSIGTSFISSLKQGADGAKAFGAEIAGGIGNILDDAISDEALFGLGGLFKTFFEFTAQSADQIKEQIKAFIDAIPDLLVNLADSGPAIAEGFIDAIFEGDFIERLVKALARSPLLEAIGDQWGIRSADQFMEKTSNFFQNLFEGWENTYLGKFIKGFEKAWNGLLNGLSKVWMGLFQPIVDGIKNGATVIANIFTTMFNGIGALFTDWYKKIESVVTQIGPNLKEGFENLIRGIADTLGDIPRFIKEGLQGVWDSLTDVFNGIIDGFRNLFKPITDLFSDIGIGGGEGGLFGGSVIPGFLAEGGVVPPGFPNDTYPAFLTSGETVVPAAKPLPEMGSEKSEVMVALLGQILSKLSEPMQVSTTAEVNGRALADIILQLNRNSARLAV